PCRRLQNRCWRYRSVYLRQCDRLHRPHARPGAGARRHHGGGGRNRPQKPPRGAAVRWRARERVARRAPRLTDVLAASAREVSENRDPGLEALKGANTCLAITLAPENSAPDVSLDPSPVSTATRTAPRTEISR